MPMWCHHNYIILVCPSYKLEMQYAVSIMRHNRWHEIRLTEQRYKIQMIKWNPKWIRWHRHQSASVIIGNEYKRYGIIQSCFRIWWQCESRDWVDKVLPPWCNQSWTHPTNDFPSQSKSIAISSCSFPNFNKVITRISCTWYDSYSILTCKNFLQTNG